MTYTAHPETTNRLSDTAWHWITAVLAALGVVAAAVGAWLAFGTTDGAITLFGWTWNVADLSDLWAPFLMIGGGLVAALSMGVESVRDWEAHHSNWLVALEAIVTIVGVAAIVIGIVLLF